MPINAGELEATLTLRDELSAKLQGVVNNLGDFQSKLSRFGIITNRAGRAITAGLTVPIVGLGVVATKTGSDFESSFAGILKTVDDASDRFGNLTATGEQLREEMLDLSKVVPIDVNQLNRIGELGGQLGIASDDIANFTDIIAKVGISTTASVEEAAFAFARLKNVTGFAIEDLDNVASVLVELGNNFAATESEILTFSQRIASTGTIIGLTVDEILAISTAMTSVGVPAERGGTALQKTFVSMFQAVTSGGQKLKDFASIADVEIGRFVELFRTDADQAILKFVEGLKRVGGEGQDLQVVLKNLDLGNVRVFQSLTSLAQASGQLKEAFAAGNREMTANQALAVEFDKRLSTLKSQFTLLVNEVKVVAIALGTALLPMLQNVIESIKGGIPFMRSLVDLFAGLSQPVQAAIVAFGLTVAAVGPLLFIMGQLSFAIEGTLGLLPLMSAALAKSSGALTIFGISASRSAVLLDLFSASTARATVATSRQAITFAGALLSWKVLGRLIASTGSKLAGFGSSALRSGTFLGGLTAALRTSVVGFAAMGASIGRYAISPLGTLVLTFLQATGILGDLISVVGNLASALGSTLVVAFRDVKDAVADVIPDIAGLGEELDQFLRNWVPGFKGYREALELAVEASADLADRQRALLREMTTVSALTDKQTDSFEKLFKRVLFGGQSMKSLTDRLPQLKSLIQDIEIASGDASPQIKLLVDKILELSATEQITPELQEFIDSLFGIGDGAGDAEDRLNDLISKFGEVALFTAPARGGIQSLNDALLAMGRPPTSRLGGVTGVEGQAAATLNPARLLADIFPGQHPGPRQLTPRRFLEQLGIGEDVVAESAEGLGLTFGRQLGDGLSEAFSNIGNVIVQAAKGGGNIGEAVGFSIGNVFGEAAKHSIIPEKGASMAQNLLGGMLGGLTTLGVGMAIQGVVSFFTSLGRSTEDNARIVGRDWGVAMSDEMVSQVAASVDSGEFRSVWGATAANLGNIIREAGGVLEFGLDDAISRARDLFSFYEMGELTTRQLGEAFNDVFGLILPEAFDMATGEMTDGFRELILTANEFLGETEAVTQFVTSLADESARLSDELAGAIAERGEIMDKVLNDGVEAFIRFKDSGAAAGVEVPRAFQAMFAAAKLLEDEIAGPLLRGINDGSEALKALDTIGQISENNFKQFSGSMADTFWELVNGGASVKGALEAIRPALAVLLFLQEKHGFAVDEDVQALLDLATQHGVTAEEGVSAADKQIEALDKVIESLERMITLLDSLVTEFGGAEGAARQLGTAIDNIPRHVSVNVDTNFDEGGFAELSDIPQAKMGGIVRKGGLVQVHDNELIAPIDELAPTGLGFTAGHPFGGSLSNVHDDEVHQEIVRMRSDFSILRESFESLPLAIFRASRDGSLLGV